MKDYDEIYAEMKRHFAEATGLAVTDGGDMALRFAAAAAQLYSLWVRAEFVERQCFPQTAEGEYLDRHAQLRGLRRTAAVKAAGELSFSIASALTQELTIAAGVTCTTAHGAAFVTTEAGVIAAGETACTVAAEAVEAGAAGNVPAGSITAMTLAPAGVVSCANAAAFTGGCGEEDDASLRERVLASYRSLPNGANAAYYESAALGVDGVDSVSVLPKNRGLGTVDVIIAAADGLPSQALVSAVQSRLDASREICVDIEVSAPTAVTVNVTASVKAAEGHGFAEVSAAVSAALSAHFSGRLLGRDVLLAKLGSVIYAVPGVENYAISSPAQDLAVEPDELPVLGVVTLTEMGA